MVCGFLYVHNKRKISAWNRREIEQNLGGAARNLDRNGEQSHHLEH